MRILVHASLDFSELMTKAREVLGGLGCDVLLPRLTRYQHIRDELGESERFNRIKWQLAVENGRNVSMCDGLLVINPDHRGVQHYIGGTSFFEMSIAFFLGKPIFLTFPVPIAMPYSEEVEAFSPVVIGSLADLTKEKWEKHVHAAGLR